VRKALLSTSLKLELVSITVTAMNLNFLYCYELNSWPGSRDPLVPLASMKGLIAIPLGLVERTGAKSRVTVHLESVSRLGRHAWRVRMCARDVVVVVYPAAYGPQL